MYKNFKIHFNFIKIFGILKVLMLNIVVIKYNDKKTSEFGAQDMLEKY